MAERSRTSTLRVQKGGVVFGPMTREELAEHMFAGKFDETDQVSLEGGPWLAIAELVDLLDAPAAPVPPEVPDPRIANPPRPEGPRRAFDNPNKTDRSGSELPPWPSPPPPPTHSPILWLSIAALAIVAIVVIGLVAMVSMNRAVPTVAAPPIVDNASHEPEQVAASATLPTGETGAEARREPTIDPAAIQDRMEGSMVLVGFFVTAPEGENKHFFAVGSGWLADARTVVTSGMVIFVLEGTKKNDPTKVEYGVWHFQGKRFLAVNGVRDHSRFDPSQAFETLEFGVGAVRLSDRVGPGCSMISEDESKRLNAESELALLGVLTGDDASEGQDPLDTSSARLYGEKTSITKDYKSVNGVRVVPELSVSRRRCLEGSPIFRSDGKVAGVLAFHQRKATMVPVSSVADVLKEN